MPLVTTKEMFEKSMKEKFAIGAFIFDFFIAPPLVFLEVKPVEVNHKLGNPAGHLAAVSHYRVGHLAHQTHLAGSEHQTDAVFGENLAQAPGCVEVSGLDFGGRGAVNGHIFDVGQGVHSNSFFKFILKTAAKLHKNLDIFGQFEKKM